MSQPLDQRHIEHLRDMVLEDLGYGSAEPSAGAAIIGPSFTGLARQRELISQETLSELITKASGDPDLLIGDSLLEQGLITPREFMDTLRQQRETWSSSSFPSLDKFFIVEELGRGGFGCVYRAIHQDLLKEVAIKVLIESPGLPSNALERFHREAMTTARLDHPNIVGVHDVGSQGDIHYIAMELVRGRTLSQWLRDEAPSLKDRLLLLQKVCWAVGYAHDQGVLHRDLKAPNIMVRDGQEPVVVDFGLARAAELSQLTHEGAVLGTPAYMAPEQLGGHVKELDARADVYALGVVLYEMVSGRLPFEAESAERLYFLIQQVEPEPPSRHQPSVPATIDAVCQKCLEKDPAARYPSAMALADELHACVQGTAITASRPSRLQRGWRQLRRRPAWLLAGLLMVAMAAIAWVAMAQRQQQLRTKYALDVQTAYTELSDLLGGALAEAEETRYAKLPSAAPSLQKSTILAQVDETVAQLQDLTGVGHAYRAWVRFLVHDASGDRILEDARRRQPDNPFLPLMSARRYLRLYTDAIKWPNPGITLQPVSNPYDSLQVTETAEMHRWLERARVDLEAARNSPVWSQLPALGWIVPLLEGFEKFARHDLNGAIEQLATVGGRQDLALESTLLSALSQYGQRRHEAALVSAEALLRRRPYLEPARRLLAECLRARGVERLIKGNLLAREDLQAARAGFEELPRDEALASTLAGLSLLQAKAALLSGDQRVARKFIDQAATAYQGLLKDRPGSLSNLVNYANVLGHQAEFSADSSTATALIRSALNQVEQACALDPRNTTALAAQVSLRLVAINYSLKQRLPLQEMLDAAGDDLDQLGTLLDDDGGAELLKATLSYYRGEAARQSGEPAAQHFKQSIELAARLRQRTPGFLPARQIMVGARMSLAAVERPPLKEILAIADDARDLGEKQGFNATLITLAKWLSRTVDRQPREFRHRLARRAANAWDAAVKAFPQQESLLLNRGQARLRVARLGARNRGRWAKDALSDLELILELQPENVKAFGSRALTWAVLGDATKARADVATLLKLSPQKDMAWWTLGLVEELLGNRAEARKAFLEGLRSTNSAEHRSLFEDALKKLPAD